MKVHRWYLVALGVVLAIVATVVIPKIVSSIRAHDAATRLAAANAAFKKLKVPADFVEIRSGCHLYPCFRVPRSTLKVRADLPAILKSVGADPDPLASGCPLVDGDPGPICGLGGSDHGYRVVVQLTPYCFPGCSPVRSPPSRVEIARPYTIPRD
jgi:hypothetical protein